MEVDKDPESRRIPRLNGNADYYTWLIYVRDLMHSQDTLFVLSVARPDDGTAQARRRWDDADRKARSAIVQNLGTQPIVAVSELLERETCSALEVWRKLESTFKKDNIQSKLNLRQKLNRLSFNDNDDVQKHLLELETIFIELARLGDPMSDRERTLTLLRTLPDSLMAITLLADANNMEYDQVVSLVRSEMDRRKHRKSKATTKSSESQGSTKHPYPSAKKSSTNKRPRGKGNKKKGVRCWKCGCIGHIRSECRQNNSFTPNNKNHVKSSGNSRRDCNRPSDREYRHWESERNSRNNHYRHHNNNNHTPRGFVARAQSSCLSAKETRTYLDSGATHVFINDKDLLTDFVETNDEVVRTCDQHTDIKGKGTILLPLGDGVRLPAKYTPSFDSNLVSLKVLSDYMDVEYSSINGFEIKDRSSGRMIYQVPSRDGLYILPNPTRPELAQVAMRRPGDTAKDWHDKLGHPGTDRLLQSIDKSDGIPKLSPDELRNIHCSPCIEGGARRAPLTQSPDVARRPLELTHTDLTGPISPPSLQGLTYIQVLLDDNSRACALYFLSSKSQFFESVRWYKARAENEQAPLRLFRVRLDGAGQNRSDDFVTFAKENGLILEYAPPYAHQSNGAAEKIIQDLWRMTRIFLHAAKLPPELWEEAISHTNYLRNRLPNSRVGMEVPYTIWFGRKPDFSNLLKFGQHRHAFIYRPETAKNKKLLPRALPGHFVGMQSHRTLYRIYVPTERKVIITRAQDFKVTKEQLPSIHDLIDFSSLRRSEAEMTGQENVEEHFDAALALCMVSHSRSKYLRDDGSIPRNFDEARRILMWAEAIDREYNALVDRKTWVLVNREPGMRTLPFLWTFIAKILGPDPHQILPKARCVARGDLQRPYMDYDPDGLYSPVARQETIRLLLAKAAAQGPILETLDISNAYLYGDLDEPLIMEQPQDSTGSGYVPGKVCLLQKSIYGAKQAGHIWGSLFHKELICLRYRQSTTDSRLYMYKSGSGFFILVVVVDDVLMSSDSRSLLEDFKEEMKKHFQVKLLGEAQSFIGLEIERNERGIKVQQSKYIEKILKEYGLSHCNTASTPLPANTDLSARGETERRLAPALHRRYRQLVGHLMYLAVSCRLDIMFASSMLARQVHDPCMRHVGLGKRVLRYLHGTKGLGLFYPSDTRSPMEAFCDADWAGCRDTRKSTTGILVKVNEAPVLWTTKKQSMIALSSGEAEYIALSYCGKTLRWMRRLFWELLREKVMADEPEMYPVSIFTDSSTAMSIVEKPKSSERNKHIDIKLHHIKELVKKGVVNVKDISTEMQAADVMTKSVDHATLQRLRFVCGLH